MALHRAGDRHARRGEKRGGEIDLPDQFRDLERAIETGALDDERNVNGAFMRAALVLGVARAEVAGVIAGEDDDGVVGGALFVERREQRSNRVIDAFHAAIIAGQLAGPRAGERAKVLRHPGVFIRFRVLLGRDKQVGIVLVMHFQVGDAEQEWLWLVALLFQKSDGAVSQEIGAVFAGEVKRVPIAIVHVAFKWVRRAFKGVRGFPEIEKAAAVGGRNRAGHLIGGGLGGEMPLADVIRGVALGAEEIGQRDGVGLEAQAIFPNTVPGRILAGEHDSAGGCADGLIGDCLAEENATAGHGVQIGREVHGVQAHAAEGVGAELVGNDEEDVGAGS